MTTGPSDFTEDDMSVDVVDPSDIDAETIKVADDDTD